MNDIYLRYASFPCSPPPLHADSTARRRILCSEFSVSVSRRDWWFVLDVVSALLHLDSAMSQHPHVSHKGVKTNRGNVELLVLLLWANPAQVGFILFFFFFVQRGKQSSNLIALSFALFCLPNIINLNVLL